MPTPIKVADARPAGQLGPTPCNDLTSGLPQRGRPFRFATEVLVALPRQITDMPPTRWRPDALGQPLHVASDNAFA